MRRTRAALTIASTALVLGSLAGCGSDGSDVGDGAGAPDDASLKDFCTTFNSLTSDLLDGDSAGSATSIKDWAADLEEVGAPSEMTDDARDGFEVFVEAASKIDGDATLEDLRELEENFSKEDTEKAAAFSAWAIKECRLSETLDDLPSDLPSDLASELEDVPTELPSDLASQLEDLSDLPSELASQLEELQESAGS